MGFMDYLNSKDKKLFEEDIENEEDIKDDIEEEEVSVEEDEPEEVAKELPKKVLTKSSKEQETIPSTVIERLKHKLDDIGLNGRTINEVIKFAFSDANIRHVSQPVPPPPIVQERYQQKGPDSIASYAETILEGLPEPSFRGYNDAMTQRIMPKSVSNVSNINLNNVADRATALLS